MGRRGSARTEVRKKKRYTEEQIAFALRQAEAGTPVGEVILKMGISERTRPTSDARRSHRWKKHDAGLGVCELRRLKKLEEENKKLTSLVADLSLDKRMLQDPLSGDA
jgi:putative transposase